MTKDLNKKDEDNHDQEEKRTFLGIDKVYWAWFVVFICIYFIKVYLGIPTTTN